MQPTLRFFTTVVSDKRNYAYITASGYTHSFERPLDNAEYYVLDKWFNDNQAEQHNVRLLIADDSKSYTLQLSKVQRGETYWSPDNLQERINELLEVESELFNHIKYLLDSTKF